MSRETPTPRGPHGRGTAATARSAPRGRHRALSLLFLGLLAAGAVDCAQQRRPIDQRQPGGLRKAFFVGANLRDATDDPEFYMNNYVVAAAASQSLMPAGTYDRVDRIRWEVQENVLLARRAYETVTNASGTAAGGRVTNGTVVAAYRIESHFDVRPAYNPSTGEELNVVVENTTDRPWYDREYMRIDWSQNLVVSPNWSWVWYGTVFGDLSFEPVRYYEQDPMSPNAPNFREMEASANQPGGYFDITTRWLVRPEQNTTFGFSIPTCLLVNFFTGSNSYECDAQETTIRTSFRRVEDRDFEPLEMTQAPYDLMGGPRATVAGYDPNYGPTDANFHRYAMIHNLWQTSHLSPVLACTSNTDGDHDGTADACASGGHPGSQCDTVRERCTLPYSERQIRTIAYYVNPDMPPDFQDHVESAPATDGTVTYRMPTPNDGPDAVVRGASEQLIATWNISIMAAIANAREVECRRLGPAHGGGDRDTCHGRYFESGLVPQEDGAFLAARPRAINGPAVVLCHNPVRQGDASACREVGYSVRLGDIRYNHLTYESGLTRAPFGGIAHWGYDPLTGEVVTNGAFNVGRSVEYAAAQQRDYIRLIWSQMTPPEDNLSVSDYVDGAPAAVLAEHIRHPGASLAPLSQTELDARVAGIDGQHAAAEMNVQLPNFGTDLARGTDFVNDVLTGPTTAATGTSSTQLAFLAQASRLQNTPLETDMIDAHWLANAGVDPRTPITSQVLDEVSPLRRLDPEATHTLRMHMMQQLEERGACFQDIAAPAMIGSADLQGVARWFLQRYRSLTPEARSRRVLQDLRIEAYKGIALHELGHSLGLYHVPVSSYDSANYMPQYWQLRTHNGAATMSCRTGCSPSTPNCPSARNADRNNDNCMGPRYIDPATDEEIGVAPTEHPHAGINYFGNTSTMEYQWERFGETVGLGAYDQYAMGLLYGRVLETMELDATRGGMDANTQLNFAPRLDSQLGEQDRIVWADPSLTTSPGTFPVHYTELGRQLNLFDATRCRDATPAEQDRFRWRLVDGRICSFGPRDHAAWTDFETSLRTTTATRTTPSWRTTPGTGTGAGAVRWNYRAAWDIGTGYPHINYFDQGADIYEVTQSIMTKFDLTYPAMYFRRGRREWLGFNLSSQVASSMFRLIRGYHWSVARDTALYASVYSAATYNAVAADDHYLRPYLVTGTAIFDFFARSMLQPEPGLYLANDDRNLPELRDQHRQLFDADEAPTDPPLFSVGVISGRYIGETFDNTAGGSWDYSHWVRREGAYMERPFSAIALTDTRPTFSSVTRDLFLDGREFQVNFRTDMPQAYDRLLGGILSEDWGAVAMHVDRTQNFGSPSGDTELEPILPRLWEPNVQRYASDGRTVLTNPTFAAVLFPNLGYRQYLPTVIYSMLFSSLNSNLDTVHRMRIFTEGGVEQVDIPEAQRVRFSNPETGITYVARMYGPDPGYAAGSMVGTRTIDRGIASRMIQHANALLADTYLTDGTNPDGTPRMTRDSLGQLMPRYAGMQQSLAATRFHNYVGLVDSTRNASRILGYGLLR